MVTQEEVLKRARTLADGVLNELAPVWERDGRHCAEALAAAAHLGLTGLRVPAEAGGLAQSFTTKAAVAEILATVDFGAAMAVLNTQNIAEKLWREHPALADRYGPALLRGERLGCTALTEPGAGSDFGAIQTQARPDGDGWVIDGRKAWIINAVAADVVVLYAQTDPAAGGRGIAAFLVDGRRDGFERLPAEGVFGQASIGAGGFRLSGYRAAADEMLSAPGAGFKAALNLINEARTYVAAMCCGMVAAAVRAARDYGLQRHTFGQPLIEHQGWRWRLAEADVALQAARLMVDAAVRAIETGEDAQLPAARAKIFAVQMAERQIQQLMHLMGAEGLRGDHPFGRHMAGASMAGFTDGATEILLDRVGRALARDAARG